MPTQESLTMSNIRTMRGEGQAEFVTHDAVIQPGQSSFASQDEFNAYLVKMLGAKTQRGGIGGSVSCKGTYVRRSADGTPAVTFGDPAPGLHLIGHWNIDIGGRTIDLTALRPGANTQGQAGVERVAGVAFDTSALKMTGLSTTPSDGHFRRWLVCGVSHPQRPPWFPGMEARPFGRRFGSLGNGR